MYHIHAQLYIYILKPPKQNFEHASLNIKPLFNLYISSDVRVQVAIYCQQQYKMKTFFEA